MEYRRDIDGLRAIAVLPVVLFHAGFDVLKGGFLGVDIFFVISGFLITSILLHELATQKFSIAKFYERRARRILPALFAVLIVTFIAGYILMPVQAFKEFNQSLISVVAFLSNIFFYSEINYFSQHAEEMPLLHTWSLAIEEQFYIFFPPLLFLIWKYGRKHLFTVLIALFIMSLGSMAYLNGSGDVSASFYLLFSRAWELIAGALCAVAVYKGWLKIDSNQLANIGLVVLLCSIFLWSKHILHPGYFTIIPVLATCFIILFPSKKSWSYKLLTNSSVVFIGLISYSLYLWHQPILAFYKMKFGELTLMQNVTALTIIAIASALTYQYVEKPFRNRQQFNTKFIFRYSAAGLVLFTIAGGIGHFKQGLPERYSHVPSFQDSIQNSPDRKKCHSSMSNTISFENACTFNADKPSWAILGDSHTVEVGYALRKYFQDKGIGFSHHSISGCPPALDYQVVGEEHCSVWLNSTLQHLIRHDSIHTVVIGFRYSADIFGDNSRHYPIIPQQVQLAIKSPSTLSEEEKLSLYWQSLEKMVMSLLAANKRVVLMEPIPELPMHITKGVTPFSIFHSTTRLDLRHATPKQYYEQRHQFILSKINSIKGTKNFTTLPVYELLCDNIGCPAVANDKALYFDHNHLSVDGSRLLIERFFSQEKYSPIWTQQ